MMHWPHRTTRKPTSKPPKDTALVQGQSSNAAEPGPLEPELLQVCQRLEAAAREFERLLGGNPQQDLTPAPIASASAPPRDPMSRPAGDVRRYLVTAGFLFFTHATLLRLQHRRRRDEADEAFVYATGGKLGDYRTLDQLISFPYSEQSSAYVAGDPAGARDALLMVEDWGQEVQAHFHTHVLLGHQAVFASHVDERHQERLERGGYPAIGGVFSQDGYLLWYANFPFHVTVYGKGVEQLDDHGHRFKLTGPLGALAL